VNISLLIGVLLLVILFRSSSSLASAYVLAVAATEWTAGVLGFIVIWKHWRWSFWGAALLMLPFIFVDTIFIAAASMKILDGAWVPVLFGAIVVLMMTTWRRGTRLLAQKTRRIEVPFEPSGKESGEKAAAYRARNGHIPDQRFRICADCIVT
jgi:KUP system potassium uptake protein